MNYDTLSFLSWTPLQNLEIAKKQFSQKLGLNSYHAMWGVGQLLFLKEVNHDWSDIGKFIDFERMNWDSRFAMDFATLASILNTNSVLCRSWREFNEILDTYRKNWKSRLLISLFCEGVNKKGYLGMPLYLSELVGYQLGAIYRNKGFLEIVQKYPGNGFDWMVLRIIDKMSDSEARRELLKMLNGDQKNLVYPFLLYGSTAFASFNKLEKMGGKKAFISRKVPKDIWDEVYMLLIMATSRLFYFGKDPKLFKYDELFSKIHIKEITHFGGDTSIRTSPHVVVLRGEIGHLISTPLGELKELGDALFRFSPQIGGPADRELSFDKVTDSSPPEMAVFLDAHNKLKNRERDGARYTINPDWLERLRTEDFE